MPDIFRVQSDGVLPPEARVRSFFGTEALSQPYTFEVRVGLPARDAASFDPSTALNRAGTLEVVDDEGAARMAFHGVWASFELLTDGPTGSLYRALLVPRWSLLALSLHSRVWVQKSVPEIIEEVLRNAGFGGDDYALRLNGRYRPWDHLCQYKESDLDFLSRWMEREGIYYYFEHDGARERLVLVDAPGAHVASRDTPVRFFPTGDLDESGVEAFEHFTVSARVTPESVTANDHNPQQPALTIHEEVPLDPAGQRTVVTFGEHAEAGARARRTAQMRAQRWTARRKVFSATGPVFSVRAGFLFELEDHPRLAYNATYLATEVVYEGDQLAGTITPHRGLRTWLVRVTAIASDAQFRAPTVAPWPRVQNLELAVVDGPTDSDYAQLDEHGRYLVKFRFDENSHTPGTASTRIRMMQPHTGEPEGMHLPLRKGTEVLIAFLGGDPDQPVIAGAVPDAERPSVVVQANETQNVIHTGGNNRIEMEDTADHQYIDLYSPPENSALHLGKHHPRGYHGGHDHNFVLTTDGDGLIHTGGNLDITVGGEKHEHVKKLVDEKYDATQTTTVKNDVTEDYRTNMTTTVKGDCHEHFGSHTTTVRGRQSETVATQTTTVRGALTETHGLQKTTVSNALSVHAGSQSLTASASSTQTYGSLTVNTTGGTVITCPAGITITAPNLRIAAPTMTCVAPTQHTAAPSHSIFKPHDEDTSASKFAMYAMQGQVTVTAKTEAYGVTIGISGIKIDNGLVKVDGTLLRCENAPTELKAGAFQMLRYGLMVIT
ncbi:MAG: type VI secretion system tip protein TssI/VgrG [Polyangiales bacterium]